MQAAIRLLDKTSLAQPKILLVEDSQFDTVFLKRILESYYPYTLIDHAELKAEACLFLKNNVYDIIFLDLNLPDTVGFEDVQIIKDAAGETPIIIVTEMFDQAIKNNVQSYGPVGIISKKNLVGQNFDEAMHEAVANIAESQQV